MLGRGVGDRVPFLPYPDGGRCFPTAWHTRVRTCLMRDRGEGGGGMGFVGSKVVSEAVLNIGIDTRN